MKDNNDNPVCFFFIKEVRITPPPPRPFFAILLWTYSILFHFS